MPKQKYRVRDGRRFHGHQPGDVVELELTDEQEARYIARGSIEKTTAAAKTSDDKKG